MMQFGGRIKIVEILGPPFLRSEYRCVPKSRVLDVMQFRGRIKIVEILGPPFLRSEYRCVPKIGFWK